MDQEPSRHQIAVYAQQLLDSDGRGKALFEYLYRRWSNGATTVGGIDAILKTYKAAGAREVIDDLVLLIDQGRSPEPPDDETIA